MLLIFTNLKMISAPQPEDCFEYSETYVALALSRWQLGMELQLVVAQEQIEPDFQILHFLQIGPLVVH